MSDDDDFAKWIRIGKVRSAYEAYVSAEKFVRYINELAPYTKLGKHLRKALAKRYNELQELLADAENSLTEDDEK